MLMPVNVRVPTPVFRNEPPAPPPNPPSFSAPENVADRLLPPTARLFEPRLIVPAPSIEPAVMPALVSSDRSMLPAAPLMRRAAAATGCDGDVVASTEPPAGGATR